MLAANNANLKSWVDTSGTDFPIQNLPFGIFKTRYLSPVAGIAIGNYVLDLVYLHEQGYFSGLGLPDGIFNQKFLNAFMALGKSKARQVRNRLSELLQHDNTELKGNIRDREIAMIAMEEVKMEIPVQIPNYTDFYSSEDHARNVGSMFRDPANALLPNWKHLPVGYHGRASSIVVSGTPIVRPKGQFKTSDSEAPVFAATNKLDFELEMAFVTCNNTRLGSSLSTTEAEDAIWGYVLFNDWSARDIQQWEYVPLGPFLGKNFASTISPWIVMADALEPFRIAGPKQEPAVLPYLRYVGNKHYDVQLEVTIKSENSTPLLISKSNFRHVYWNSNQQLAHHTANGCNIEVGDLYASGTISGPTEGSYGSLLELASNGKKPIRMSDGSDRIFLSDGDTVTFRAYAEREGIRIGFGECLGTVMPALT